MQLAQLRKEYHQRVCKEIIRLQRDGRNDYPNFADKGSKASREIAKNIVRHLDCTHNYKKLSGQTAGGLFEEITKDFLEQVFALLKHLRPGKWYYSTSTPISEFDQYDHLASLEKIVEQYNLLASALGTDYIIKPDIVIGRWPVSDSEINKEGVILTVDESVSKFTPLRESNLSNKCPILHASISCKWTLRSDRGQNARTEALNLIRNRKGHLPHIVAVTAEPLPTRIASLALGTGDLDCVYHFALDELRESITEIKNADQMEMLLMLIEGRRLRDISDLPFDLAI
ncbi:MAG: restriction endonuclease [Anaerolineaceae bacterium]|nr:restriction endonuclease [Anaerolineaceae bacterium]